MSVLEEDDEFMKNKREEMEEEVATTHLWEHIRVSQGFEIKLLCNKSIFSKLPCFGQ